MEPTDQQLVSRARQGDRDACRAIVERYQRRVYGIAVGMMKNADDALDVTQEVFVKLFRSLHQFKGDSSFYTWLYRIVVNLCIDQFRKRAKMRSVEYDDRLARDGAIESTLPLSGSMRRHHPAAALENAELARAIEQALDSLSENHRAIILLREVDGMSYEEIAEVMDCHLGTVMSRLHHARKNLQKALKPYLIATGSGLAAQAGGGVRKRS